MLLRGEADRKAWQVHHRPNDTRAQRRSGQVRGGFGRSAQGSWGRDGAPVNAAEARDARAPRSRPRRRGTRGRGRESSTRSKQTTRGGAVEGRASGESEFQLTRWCSVRGLGGRLGALRRSGQVRGEPFERESAIRSKPPTIGGRQSDRNSILLLLRLELQERGR